MQVCQEHCDNMWKNVMTCDDMWWPRSGRIAKIFICTVLGASAAPCLVPCHFGVNVMAKGAGSGWMWQEKLLLQVLSTGLADILMKLAWTNMSNETWWGMVKLYETIRYSIMKLDTRLGSAARTGTTWSRRACLKIYRSVSVTVSEPVPVHKLDRVKDGWHPSRVHFSVFEQLCFLFSDFSWTFVIWLVEKIGELAFMLGNSLDMIFP